MQKRRFGSKADTADEGTESGSDSADRYERSSERRGASSKSSGFKRSNKQRADAKSFASARRVFEPVKDGESSEDASDRAARLEQARALLKQATEQPKARPVDRAPPSGHAHKQTLRTRSHSLHGSFEDADPFEPFEQCAPAEPAPVESAEPVYSRSSQRTRKPSATRSQQSQTPAALAERARARIPLAARIQPGGVVAQAASVRR